MATEPENFNMLEIPFDPGLGFPQKIFVTAGVFTFIYRLRINSYDDSFIMEVTDATDGLTLFVGKIVEGYDIGITGPNYGRAIMYVIPKILERTSIVVEMLPPGLNPDFEGDYVD